MVALWLLLLLPAVAGAHPTGFAPGWNGKAAKPPMGALPPPSPRAGAGAATGPAAG